MTFLLVVSGVVAYFIIGWLVLGEGDEKYDHWRSVLNNIERQLTA